MSKANILIIEDDQHLSVILDKFLTHQGYDCFVARSGADAFDLLEEHIFQLALIDVMLPDTDGWSILRHIREMGDLPSIMLTARNEEDDKLLGFELGADDYITKPFSNKLLQARIKAVLNRYNKNIEEDVLKIDDITLNKLSHEVIVDGEEVSLTPIEYSLLLYLMNNVGIVLSRLLILDSVWGYDYYGDERTVDTHIKRLRKKLENSGSNIVTVRGTGYRMVRNEK